jgi:nicotinamidase/pyrazinamidase
MTRRLTSQVGDALIIVDLQRDFCPGGALAVPAGDQIIGEINRLAATSPFVVATRDWHPLDHHSFATQGGPWPVHCVRDTPGAELDPRLDRELVDLVVDKGLAPDLEGYSGFEATQLETVLRERGVLRVHVAGLALDYCVKHTALDARRLGFTVIVHHDATRAVDLRPGDGEHALEELAAAGVEIAP